MTTPAASQPLRGCPPPAVITHHAVADVSSTGGDEFVLAGRRYRSRLIVGTGKYRDFDEMGRALSASGAEIVTVALRRVELTPASPACLRPSIAVAISSCRTPPAATPPKMPSAPAGWRVS